VTRKGPEGSNPSPGAHLEKIRVYFKTDGYRGSQSCESRIERRHLKAAATLNDTASIPAAAEAEYTMIMAEND
jgi:hypothetical protein